jgi:hypothetical protein
MASRPPPAPVPGLGSSTATAQDYAAMDADSAGEDSTSSESDS